MLEQQTYSWSMNLRVLCVASLVNSDTLKMYPKINAATSWNINPHRYLHVDATSRDVRRFESFHIKKVEPFHQLPNTQKTEEPNCTASPTSEPHIPHAGLCALSLSLQRSLLSYDKCGNTLQNQQSNETLPTASPFSLFWCYVIADGGRRYGGMV